MGTKSSNPDDKFDLKHVWGQCLDSSELNGMMEAASESSDCAD